MTLVLPRDEYDLLKDLASKLGVLMATAAVQVPVEEEPKEKSWSLNQHEILELIAWLARPSGTHYPVPGTAITFEARANARIAIKVRA